MICLKINVSILIDKRRRNHLKEREYGSKPLWEFCQIGVSAAYVLIEITDACYTPEIKMNA